MPREALSPRPPKELAGRAREVYKGLASELIAEGYAARADWRAVALTAKTEAHVERLEEAVAALADLVVHNQSGVKTHPLVGELRAARAQLAGLYGALFLTPRARAASRLAGDSNRQAGRTKDELAEFLDGE